MAESACDPRSQCVCSYPPIHIPETGLSMRTNVVIDDELIAEAMRLTDIRTKRQVIDTALRTLVRLRRQRELLTLEGAIDWEGDLDALRTSRLVDVDVEATGNDANVG